MGSSRLLAARVRMQQKYLDQFYDLYEVPCSRALICFQTSVFAATSPLHFTMRQDFHIVKLPLLEEEVRGIDSLREFSASLIQPYQPAPVPAARESCVLVPTKVKLSKPWHLLTQSCCRYRVAELQAECDRLRQRCAELEAQKSS